MLQRVLHRANLALPRLDSPLNCTIGLGFSHRRILQSRFSIPVCLDKLHQAGKRGLLVSLEYDLLVDQVVQVRRDSAAELLVDTLRLRDVGVYTVRLRVNYNQTWRMPCCGGFRFQLCRFTPDIPFGIPRNA